MNKALLFLIFSALTTSIFAQNVNCYSLSIFQPSSWTVYSSTGETAAQGTSPEATTFCVSDGCFQVYVESMAMNPLPLLVSVSDASGNVLNIENQGNEFYYIGFLSNNGVTGCTDPSACNFNPNATCFDYISCDYSCLGCTNPEAFNYNPNATADNGTCCIDHWATFQVDNGEAGIWLYSEQYFMTGGDNLVNNQFCVKDGCYSLQVYSFNNSAVDQNYTVVLEDGSTWLSGIVDSNYLYTTVSLNPIYGCADFNACNYNPGTTCNDGSCEYASCSGCTDPTATNYDPNATVDNGTCCFNNWYTVECSTWIEWYVTSSDELYQQGGYNNMLQGFCMEQNCFSLNVWSLNVAPFNLTIYGPDGSIFYQTTNNPNPYINEYFSVGEIIGCTDPFACNYNPNATCANYNLCDYSCFGCTNASAPNYDSSATVDDGSCCDASNWNTISATEQVVFYAFNPNTGEGDFNEFPYVSGYCMSATSCYQLVLYSFSPENNNVTVSNAQGEVVLEGNLADFGYLQAYVSSANEIAGCIDPMACNYESTATCDVGSCLYYCGGCVDPMAANYSDQAQFDDGSCVYTTDLPNMGMMLMEDPANNQFYVLMDLASMGTGGPYGVMSSLNEPAAVMSTTGQTLKGPYACGTEVQFTVHDMGNNMQTAMTSPVYTMACGVGIGETIAEGKNEIQLYPNPARTQITIKGLEKGMLLEVLDLTGRIVHTEKVTTEQMQLNVAKWQTGLYLVRVGGTTLRLVKE
ncbi:MAG: T9SS type A sorting domain-containing protein [Bacteroidetes bacterium]|nr:T9SS type A sorting domain-containing protein [Bacteroidota bacterium]